MPQYATIATCYFDLNQAQLIREAEEMEKFLNQRCVIVLKNPRLRLRLLLNKKKSITFTITFQNKNFDSNYEYAID